MRGDKMVKQLIIFFILIHSLYGDTNKSKGIMSLIDIELDPYYSNAGYYQAIDNEPIKDVGKMSELNLYKHLIFSYQKPKFFLVEASVNPLPIVGVYLKKEHKETYDDAHVTNEFNYIKTLTAGFEEPYALSFFLGNVVTFSAPNEQRESQNKGYFGYLLSIGNKHIKDNELIDDNWYEIEVKVKGDRDFTDSKLGYSFRFGIKVHNNHNIQDIYYVGLRRSMTDFIHKNDFTKNFGFDVRSDFSQKNNVPIRHLVLFEKSFHNNSDYAFSVKTGFVWENNQKYLNKLQREEKDSNYQFIIQPTFVF
jgi:hypothetical protein